MDSRIPFRHPGYLSYCRHKESTNLILCVPVVPQGFVPYAHMYILVRFSKGFGGKQYQLKTKTKTWTSDFFLCDFIALPGLEGQGLQGRWSLSCSRGQWQRGASKGHDPVSLPWGLYTQPTSICCLGQAYREERELKAMREAAGLYKEGTDDFHGVSESCRITEEEKACISASSPPWMASMVFKWDWNVYLQTARFIPSFGTH